jgi:hypothetical protein
MTGLTFFNDTNIGLQCHLSCVSSIFCARAVQGSRADNSGWFAKMLGAANEFFRMLKEWMLVLAELPWPLSILLEKVFCNRRQ